MIFIFCILVALGRYLGFLDMAQGLNFISLDSTSLAILLLADVILFKDFEIKVKIKNEKTCKCSTHLED